MKSDPANSQGPDSNLLYNASSPPDSVSASTSEKQSESLGSGFPKSKQPQPQQASRAFHRSLPKRVFSSPPSFTGRSFGFGSRKRSISSTKTPNLSVQGGRGLTEGDSDSITKISRGIGARSAVHDGNIASLSLTSDTPNFAGGPSPERSANTFRTIVEAAASGKVPLSTLLDSMFRLEERLVPDIKDILVKYFSRQENMEALISCLTIVLPSNSVDNTSSNLNAERERYRYSYVSCMLLSNGPIQLRRSLFLNPKHLARLVDVLGFGTPTDPVVVRSVCKVLLSVLRDSPEDTVHAMEKRKDFIDALLSHISVTGCPEVCLSMLSTVRCQAELKFGPSNRPVVGMMADSKFVDLLCNKLSDAAEKGPLNGKSSSTIENCSRVIVGIALRALVIPRLEVNDDDPDIAERIKFNRDISSLDVFTEPRPILRLLDSGLNALLLHDTRGYALSTALTAARYLLVTALNGQDSSLSAIRIQLMHVNTAAYEGGLRARIGKMARVLENARNGIVVETMWNKVQNPLGVVRLKILELIMVLLQHCTEATAMAIITADIPGILMRLFTRLKLNSLLQHFVSAILELSFTSQFACLRKAFLVDVRIMDIVMKLWDETSVYANYTGELMRIACVVHEFIKQKSMEWQEYEQVLGKDVVERFTRFVEGPVTAKLRENGSLLCGGELPSRHDGFINDPHGSTGELFQARTGYGGNG